MLSDAIHVDVIYALPDHQEWISLIVPAGSTVRHALEMSGFLLKYPDIDVSKNKLGIFGKIGSVETVLRDYDRVEIYRPLLADPKESRRKRASRQV